MDTLRFSIMQLCEGGWCRALQTNWLAKTIREITKHPQYDGLDVGVVVTGVDGFPPSVAHNIAVERAKEFRADFLLMIEGDVSPDLDPTAEPFFETAFKFADDLDQACVVVAPVQTGSGEVRVWKEVANPDGSKRLDPLTTAECRGKTGIECVPAAGLGLAILDMRAFEVGRLEPAYFGFYAEELHQTRVTCPDEAAFTTACSEAGIPVYVAWDCWPAVYKVQPLGRP